MIKGLIILGLLVVIPTVSAGWGATNEGGYQEYLLDDFAQSRANPATGTIFSNSITVTPTHDYEIESSVGLLTFTYSSENVIGTGQSGIYNFAASWDGVAIPMCNWQLHFTGTVSQQYHFHAIYCSLSNAQMTAGSHTLSVARSIQSGAPTPIAHETISYKLTRQDLLEPDTMNDLIEFFNLVAPLLFFVGVLVWAETTKEPLVYALAILCGGVFVVAMWSEIVVLRWLTIGLIVLVGARGFFAYQEMKHAKENEE